MAKKPGLVNDPKNMGGPMNPLKVANLMAQAATVKVQKSGKDYLGGANGDEVQPKGAGDKADPGKGGTKHSTEPARIASKYSGEDGDEMSGGADHPSLKKSKVSGKQVAAMKHKEGK